MNNTNILQKKPLDLFNLSKNYSWNELKQSYKTLAIHTHPDKGGDKEIFDYITKCFKHLAIELKKKDDNKNHFELKNLQSESIQHSKPVFDPSQNFHSQFNNLFEEYHIGDDDSNRGYGDMMTKSTKSREDINIPNIFNNSTVSNNTFNQRFESDIKPSKELILYKNPQPLYSQNTLNSTTLGQSTNDFSGNAGSIQYTDYRVAFSNQRIPTKDLSRKEFRSVKEYQQYSNKVLNRSFTQKEIEQQLKDESIQKRQEEKRIKRLEQQDQRINQHYQTISKLFLT